MKVNSVIYQLDRWAKIVRAHLTGLVTDGQTDRWTFAILLQLKTTRNVVSLKKDKKSKFNLNTLQRYSFIDIIREVFTRKKKKV